MQDHISNKTLAHNTYLSKINELFKRMLSRYNAEIKNTQMKRSTVK